MSSALQRLAKLMPPPIRPRHADVDWPLLEEHVGLIYPRSFKDFVKVYGSCTWFDKLLPFYASPSTPRAAREFVGSARRNLKWLDGNMYDKDYKPIDVPIYPEEGGLFPFMADIDGPLYCWLTKAEAPERWPVYCWMTGAFIVLRDFTINDMLLGFMERSKKMMAVWGDIRDYEPHRIRIDNVCAN